MTATTRLPAASTRRLSLAVALALAAAAASGAALAATADPPSAQPLPQLSTQQLPPVTPPQASFVLRGVRFAGNTVFSDAELQALVVGAIGKPATLADLDALAKKITAMYRQRGYAFAQALVPVQEVHDGVVEISVVEGKLGTITIEIAPGVPVSEARIRRILAPLQPGQPVNARSYERVMLLVSDLPGVKAQSALMTGSSPGTTDLVLKIAKAPRVNGVLGLDDFGTREAGTVRLGGSLRVNSPFGIGDNFDVRALVSQDSNTVFGRLSYEAPIGYNGLRLGGGVAHVNYSLGGAFAPLDALGTADIYDLSFTYPVLRQRQQNLFLRGFVDEKQLTDELRAVSFTSHKRVHGAGVGWAWEKRDGWGGGGYWSSNGALYDGNLDIQDPASRAFDQSVGGAHTQGDFLKLTWKFSRLQAITPRNTLYVAAGGQWTNHNLDSSEKFSLGGNNAVRSYPVGELLVDTGWLATAEWRFALQQDTTLYAFYDAARGELLHDPVIATGNARSLRGPGVGFSWTRPDKFSLDLTLAWHDTGPAVTGGGDHQPRVFFNFQKFF